MPTISAPSQTTTALPEGIKVRHGANEPGSMLHPKPPAANNIIAGQSSSVALRRVRDEPTTEESVTAFDCGTNAGRAHSNMVGCTTHPPDRRGELDDHTIARDP